MKWKRILYFPLSLFPWQLYQDARNVMALKRLQWFTHVFLKLPAWQEVRRVAKFPLVLRAIHNIRESGAKIIWARNLWPSYLARADVEVTRRNLTDTTFYVRACERVRAEADAIGIKWCSGCGLDIEPYNANRVPLSRYLRSNIPPARRRLINASARAAKGMVDFITPCSSYRTWYYPYMFTEMGVNAMTQNTYYLESAHDRIVTNPPNHVDEHLDVWGHAMSGKGRTIEEVKAFNVQAMKARGFSGQFCWIPKAKIATTIADKQWEKR